jgi:phage terminase large subunit-like protein
VAARKHAITVYADKVASGKVPAGALHRLACERHLRDLQAKRFRFDVKAADLAISFFPKVLRHYKGEWAGHPVTLEPWQAFNVGSLWGWRQEDELRRYRLAFDELCRGNGKSTMAGGIALLGTFFDDEPGADGFSVATKKDQARIVFDSARRMVLASPGMGKRGIVAQKHEILHDASASKFLPLGADADTLDGLRPHIVIADEVHAHKSPDVIEIMQTGMGTRRHPLLFEITTAGQERESIWWQHREYSRQVLEGVIEDETWFAFIACADDEDDWQDPATWRKANPNYGVSVKPDDLQNKCKQAVNMPPFEPKFRRLHCGQFVEQDGRIIPRAQWDACGEDYDWSAFVGRDVYAGLDLSKTTDLTACTWTAVDPAGVVRAWPQMWIPEAKLATHTDRVPYRMWADRGWITVTPGNVVDYGQVRADIIAKAKTCRLRGLGYDEWNATETAQHLMRELGDEVVMPVRQGFATLSEPTKRLIALLASAMFRHPKSPPFTWTADNLAVATDPAGNVKPDKAKSRQKIDPMVAFLTGFSLWLKFGAVVRRQSRYSRPDAKVEHVSWS